MRGKVAACVLGLLAAGAALAAEGRQVALGVGREVYLICDGAVEAGQPTIVMVSGYHDSADPWIEPAALELLPQAAGPPVMPALARDHHVCAYDRPGTLRYIEGVPLTERSTPVGQPRTVRDLGVELREVLAEGGVPGPYLLVGHSLGGAVSFYFGRAYPEETAGIVFVDALNPDVRRRLGPRWPLYRDILDPAQGAQPVAAFRDAASESVDLDASFDQIEALPPLRPMPLAVLTKTEPFRLPPEAIPAGITGPEIDAAYVAAQQGFVRAAPSTPQILATGSEHYIQLSQPDLVAQATVLVFDRIVAEKH